jgi:hypothetical protein
MVEQVGDRLEKSAGLNITTERNRLSRHDFMKVFFQDYIPRAVA